MKGKIFKQIVAFAICLGLMSVIPVYNLITFGANVEAGSSYGDVVDYGDISTAFGETWWKLNSEGTLYVGGTGRVGYARLSDVWSQSDYDSSISPWYDSYYGTIKKVVVEEGITEISNWAFSGLMTLKTVNLPSTLTTIGARAFYNDIRLTTVNISNNTTNIMSEAFGNCSKHKLVYYEKTNEDNTNEETLLEHIKQLSGNEPTSYIFIDMDHDGAKEMIAAIANTTNHNYDIWYCSSDNTVCELSYSTVEWCNENCGFNQIDYDNESHVIVNSGNTMGNGQYAEILSLHNGKITQLMHERGILRVNDDKKSITLLLHSYDVDGAVDIETVYVYDIVLQKYVEDTSINFAAATIAQYNSELNIGDEAAFEIFLYDTDNNLIKLTSGLDYIVSISDTNVIALNDDMPTDNYINIKAIGSGTATITVTFSNGVTASSTVTVSDNGNVPETSNYDKVFISSNPEKFIITYDSLTGIVSPNEQDFTITLSYNDLSAVIDGEEKSVEISAIEVTAPEKCILITEGETTGNSNSYLKVINTELSTNGNSHSMNLKLKAPDADYFATHNNVSDKLVVKLYDSNSSVVKTAEFDVSFKVKNNNIPDGTIIIDENVNGDIVVEEGQDVVVNGNISCNNLYVKGGKCTIASKSSLTVMNNVEISGGGVTTWLPTDVFDESGGELTVNGTLTVNNNMTVGKPCGILVMEKEESVVDVKRDFTVSNQSTKYISTLSAGKLKIGGNFKCGLWYGGNFKATGTHTTIFTGTDFTIEMDHKDNPSYFNNLGFTEAAVAGFHGTLYRDNINGYFEKVYYKNGEWYHYNPKIELWNLCSSDSASSNTEKKIRNSIIDLYKKSMESDMFKDLKPYLSDKDYKRINGDVLSYCVMHTVAANNNLGELFDIDFEFGVSASRDVLMFPDVELSSKQFTNSKTAILYVEINSTSAAIGSSWGDYKNINWYLVPKGTKTGIKNSTPHLLSNYSIDNIYNDLTKYYSQLTVETASKVTKDVLKEFGVNSYSANKLIDLINKLTKSCISGDFSDFKLTEWTKKDWYKKMFEVILESEFDIESTSRSNKVAKICCPVDVEITDEAGRVVGLIENNKVVIESDDVSISIENGDDKICKFNSLANYNIKITGTDNGIMDYTVEEYNNGINFRTITFNNLPVSVNKTYQGELKNVILQTTDSYALKDEQGNIYNSDDENTNSHIHSYTASWSYDTTSHWHECGCGDKTDMASHVSNNGVVTVQPTATSTGVRTYSCSVCGYVMSTETIPATENNYDPVYPYNPTPSYPDIAPNITSSVVVSSVSAPTLKVKAKIKGDTVTLTWNKIKGAESYTVYQYKNGKYVKLKETDKTAVTYKKLKNGKTYKFLVKYTKNGRLSSTANSGKVSVTIKYKPVVKATSTQNSVTLKWSAVDGAEKYAIYKYVNGKAKKQTETTKTAVKITKLTPNTEYSYIVRAYVNGKWTTMTKSDIVTIETK